MLSGVIAASAITRRNLVNEIRNGATIADRRRMNDWDKNFDALEAIRGLTGTRQPEIPQQR